MAPSRSAATAVSATLLTSRNDWTLVGAMMDTEGMAFTTMLTAFVATFPALSTAVTPTVLVPLVTFCHIHW